MVHGFLGDNAGNSETAPEETRLRMFSKIAARTLLPFLYRSLGFCA